MRVRGREGTSMGRKRQVLYHKGALANGLELGIR